MKYLWKTWNLRICSQAIIFCCNTHDRNCQTIVHSKTYYYKQPTFASNYYFISHFFSCFSKWNFIGYFLRQMSFKIYIDSRVSVLFSIPTTRKDFSVTDLTRNEKYFERILHGFVLLVLAGLYEYRSSQCLERTYRAKFGRFSARCFIDWNRNVLFKIRSLFEIVFFFNINWKRPKTREFENTSMIVLKLYNFAAFSYSVNFVLGIGPVYIFRVYKYCFFMHLYISRVTSKIIISLSHIFNFSFVLFSTR